MLLSVIDADMAQAGCGNSALTELAPGRGCAVTVGLGRGAACAQNCWLVNSWLVN